MSRVLIHTEGTLGDHLPTIALGRALAARGHRVTLAVNPAMCEWAQRSGLTAVALPDIERGPEQARRDAWAWDHWNDPDPAAHSAASRIGEEEFLAQVRALAGLCAGTDLLLSTSIRFLGLLAQRASGVPWLTFSLNPYAFWRPVDARELAMQREGSREHHRRMLPLLARVWDGLDLPGPLPEWSPGWHFARHVLLASSTAFSRPDPGLLQPRQSVDQTGFWWYEDPAWEQWRPDPALEAFCAQRPIVLSFSSQPLEDPAPILARHVEAARLLGVPLLVQSGWAGFSERLLPAGTDRERVFFADFLPQDWLFARAACSIQHGGIGTIARALRAGCPILVEPFGNDQLYNASRVSLLGAGAAVQPFATTAEGLARVLAEKVLTAAARERAAAVGTRIGADRGLEHACRLIEAFLAHPDREEAGTLSWQVPTLAAIEAGGPTSAAVPAAVAPAHAPPIPHVVHQSWRDAAVPDDLAGWRRTWREQNPGWQLRLWTDDDNRELIRRDYAWFLPIYDGYAEPIMRADAARCFVLHRHGGVYADLDCECLRPLGPLLEGRQIVLGLEPESHREQHFPGREGLRPLVSNACMASVPGHPFWEHLARELVRYHRAPGPLDATGPFLLTRACLTWAQRDQITLVPPSLLSPIASDEPWEGLDPEVRAAIERRAFVVHHWRGSWWRAASLAAEEHVGLALLESGKTVGAGTVSADWLEREATRRQPQRPLVSCLMVTKDRGEFARRAVRCFQRQQWPERELVIVDDGSDDAFAAWAAGLGDPGIRHLRLPPSGQTLGELRNLALAAARGAYVAQWDDDDLSDPRRLGRQMAALLASGASACLLERQQLWWPRSRRLAVSRQRLWEGSFVAEKAALGLYPELRRGEDTPVIERLVAAGRVALLDAPHLYVYVFHGGNTFGKEHWEEHWATATEIIDGQTYDARVEQIRAFLGEPGTEEGTPAVEAAPPPATPAPDTQPTRPGAAAPPPSTPPRVLLLTPVRDAVAFLPRFLDNLRALAWPRDRLALAFLEGDSRDGTGAWLEQRLPALRQEFARAELFRRDFGLALDGPRWETGVQRQRRATLARARNLLLSRALREEEWVLWVDVDVARWPPDLIGRLLAPGKRIVVPHCRREGTGETFDLNTFKIRPGTDPREMERWVTDGILQPPRGVGRIYLSELQDRDLVEVDGVGGTVLLVSADLHREGLIFPPVPYRRHIETEGLSFLARDMGVASWGLPRLEVWHP